VSRFNSTTKFQRQKHLEVIKIKKNVITSLWMLLLILIAIYVFIPLYWLVIATTKNTNDLINTNPLLLSSHMNLISNFTALFTYQHGVFWRWFANSFIYASVTAVLVTLFSAMGGYALCKYNFGMSKYILAITVGAMMIPQAAMCLPIFMMEKSIGALNTYFSVILPQIASPFGIFFMNIYIKDAMPSEILDAGRVDGAGELKIFFRIVLSIIKPGIVTLFLIVFIGSWNNFFLPLVLLSKTTLYPVTVGLEIWVLNIMSPSGTGVPLYALITCGSLVCVLPMLILFPILRKYITAGISFGGVK
jgi:multiple sugar transport system permease protein